ncbi:hypothetical protein QQS42_17535 (plasmid) [Glutamicibacter nicotianae]|nr:MULTISPECIES: hypothetical protein [Glutamicibacter]QRQ80607.1 hypothetical protein JQN66_18180 [Glutamicibacter protophormiae]WIV45759.1 hypothetical protein QQS42_17535 [Glutamicibacter nicotianae]
MWDHSGSPLRCGHLGGSQAAHVGPGDENDTDSIVSWCSWPSMVGRGPVGNQRRKAGFASATMYT